MIAKKTLTFYFKLYLKYILGVLFKSNLTNIWREKKQLAVIALLPVNCFVQKSFVQKSMINTVFVWFRFYICKT